MRTSSSVTVRTFFGILCVIVAILVVVALRHISMSEPGTAVPSNIATSTNGDGTPASPNQPTTPYDLSKYDLSFEYPNTYFVIGSSTGNGSRAPLTQISLAHDTDENRHLNDPGMPPREGPISISLAVYSNPDRLSPDDWARAHAAISNYAVRTGEGTMLPSAIAAHNVFQFKWDGLYSGESDIMVNGPYAYVWSVTYQNENDPIIQAFRDTLSTITFSIPEDENPSLR
jgi:hypothetical protein